ncbi:outer membrane receptor protein involved in Fe transport [Aquimarina sp. EL_43]|uniref:TonB-dependent receptor n=1 Tax=unclassified Aquimarina TaxID=2627091 RepID=UPI0018CA7828|nr:MULTISPECIES: TonB-dependent receptor [unclassified Aquimarina]MBG6132027.1 outer membrane receptor protein involved in Fe transport [Aquimarina sp. EL_35]MBG6149591.1 outer membrane receptor protein involved in Fe transport [Aquimarina sp. EL_32]MBG6170146.1 outer membrane receptor protein involved in Fe transport [Aquimarina sp. EL_43]
MKKITLVIMMMVCIIATAQTTISGKVVDDGNQPIPGANITLKNSSSGTVTDFDGIFTLTVQESPPFTIIASSVGFESSSIDISSQTTDLTIVLKEGTELDEVVISASRTPERIFESPVSVERFGIKEIKNTPSVDFYDGLENLKGVDVNTNSLTFKSINTRGFATFANTRFVQLVDGMDNTAPALNFVLGNLLGMTELDVNSVELLPGASSALYGANAFNGILFMTSKNPFDHHGISAYFKGGITSQEAAGDNEFYDYGIRLAHKFSEKFAAKANFSYLRGTDWFATNTVNVLNPITDRSDPNYDGLNVYGDEVSTNIRGVGEALVNRGILPAGAENLLPDESVSRTGYNEQDLNANKAESIKFDAALHYRPFANDFEVIYNGKVGRGTTIYQGANRYSIRNFFLQQHKLEFKNNNFFVRGYLTDESAGDSYDIRFTGININRKWKDDQTWFGEYAGAFVQATLAGQLPEQAHLIARQTADTGRLIPGTPGFEQAFQTVTSDPNLLTGSKFQDATQLRHVDVNYNLSHITGDFADIQVGGSFREYKLNSSGTIFTDFDKPIRYSEYGAYTQIQKKFADERVKVTGSVRYDKSELFDGNLSPRLSIGYTLGAERNHNIRASVQTGFRNPTTQDLYIGLDVGRAILVGSARDNLDRDVRTFSDLSGAGETIVGSNTVTVTGRAAYENSFSASSVTNGAPEASNANLVEPEKITAFEVGYRGKVKKFIIDLSGYYNQYTDFISNENVIVPLYGQVGDGTLSLLALQNDDFKVYQAYTNSDVDIKSFGATIGVNTRIPGDFDLGVNYTYAEQDFDKDKDPDFITNFNTPKHKVKATFGHANLFKNFGFNTSYRWSDSYFWEASFGNGNIPSFSVIDAQINYKIPKLKTTLKAGATNIGGDEYFTAFGTGFIGSQYYIGLSINNL